MAKAAKADPKKSTLNYVEWIRFTHNPDHMLQISSDTWSVALTAKEVEKFLSGNRGGNTPRLIKGGVSLHLSLDDIAKIEEVAKKKPKTKA